MQSCCSTASSLILDYIYSVLSDSDFTVSPERKMRLAEPKHAVWKQRASKGSRQSHCTFLHITSVFLEMSFFLLVKYISTLSSNQSKGRERLPVLAVMSCRTNGRLVTIPEPRGRKSLETLQKHVTPQKALSSYIRYWASLESPLHLQLEWNGKLVGMDSDTSRRSGC